MIILLVLLSIVLGSWCRGLFPLLTMLPLWCVFHSVLPNPSAIIGVNGYVYLLLDELLTKSSLDMDTWKMQKENILITWQTPVSVRALIGWLQVRGCRFKSWILSSFTYFWNMICAVKLRVLGVMAYWYTGSAFHQIPQSYLEESFHSNWTSLCYSSRLVGERATVAS